MSKVEFIEKSHTYVNSKGVIIPSVSEIIRFKFPDAYKGVPEKILKQKASYGSKCHQMIEDFAFGKITMEEIKKKRIDPNIKIAVEEFERLRKLWCFYFTSSEQIVDWQERYAGQYDLLTMTNEIVDIKTTKVVHEDWLSVQLGLYQRALGLNEPRHYCLWLPKGEQGKVIPIKPISWEECEELINDFEEEYSKYTRVLPMP